MNTPHLDRQPTNNVVPLEEALRVNRHASGPWEFSGPMNAMLSDCYPWGSGPQWGGFLDVLQRMLTALYKNGYAIVTTGDSDVAPGEVEA